MLLLPSQTTEAATAPRMVNAAPVLQQSPPKRLLVIAPHPDDESLAAAAMIRQTLNAGGRVRIVVMTNGDGYRGAAAQWFGLQHPTGQDMQRLGVIRQQEELHAVGRLGVKAQDVTFLGYPDAGLHRLWLNHWNPDRPYQAVNGSRFVPYANSYHPQAPYCGQSVVGDLTRLLREYRPTDVLYPDPHDVHRDHWATSAFTQYVLTAAAGDVRAREWNYLIHYPRFPSPRRYRPEAPLQNPGRLADIGAKWMSLPISKEAEADKHAAILEHKSQVQMMKNLLESFVRTNDLLSAYSIPDLPDRELQPIELDDIGDQKTLLHSRSADIRELLAVSKPSLVQLAVVTTRPLRPQDECKLYLRLPERGAQYEFASLARYRLPMPAVSWSQHGNLMLVNVPRSLFDGAKTVMIGAEVTSRGNSSDSTAWRRFRLR
ncbi:hypothetical protein EL26_22840 [Tumebacillus flagellatus]|uniref:LmbE family protein n=2 Tax=Tumebacillus flagellatus TaxID=1157490 RepID=A0A074LMI8_9BACL|nr:hypothetical protein EL26_22840 [Tumebacillus flagellatus]